MTNEETLKTLNTTYRNDNSEKPVLDKALSAVLSLYPNVTDNNGDVWQAISNKQAIKDFYAEFVTSDYAVEKNIDLDSAEKEVMEALHNFLNTIKGNPNAGGKNAFNQYLQEISNYDITNDFQCGLFPSSNNMIDTNFPRSTLSFIAGRPSAGKTTALTSIAMYAMRKTKKNVLFITSEETTDQLITRFIKNQFCSNCVSENKGELLVHNYGKSYINDTFKSIITQDRKYPSLIETTPKNPFKAEVLRASREVESYIASGRLQLFDLDKTTSFKELKDKLLELDRYTVVIIDYIQNLPYAPEGTPGNDRLEFLRRQIFEINTTIKAHELIGIAGAQFNREGANEHYPESLELNKLGDSGEIERKAVIVIGLGRKINEDNSTHYFYRVMKNRFADISVHYEIEAFYQYSFMRPKIEDEELCYFDLKKDSSKNIAKEKSSGKPSQLNKKPVFKSEV